MMAVLKLARLRTSLTRNFGSSSIVSEWLGVARRCCEASNLEPMSYQSFALATDLHRLVLCERQLRWCAAARLHRERRRLWQRPGR